MIRPEIVESVSKVLAIILDDSHKEDYTPWFWRYYGNLVHRDHLLRLLREMDDDFALARFDPTGKTILDAGCGFGIQCLIMRLMGSREVHGIDVSQSVIETFEKLLKILPSIEKIYPKTGDVAKAGYPDSSFDLVWSNEAISHYYDIPDFLRETYRMLKPGGTLFISDSNNGANPYLRWQIYRFWDRLENGPQGTIHGHTVTVLLREMRACIVREAFPDFKEEEVESLAAGTFGRTKEEVLDACRLYKENGAWPKSYYRYGIPPLEPNTGSYIERLICPSELTKLLQETGFKCRVYGYLGGAGGNSIIRAVNRIVEALSPLTWPAGRGLKIVAVKPTSVR